METTLQEDVAPAPTIKVINLKQLFAPFAETEASLAFPSDVRWHAEHIWERAFRGDRSNLAHFLVRHCPEVKAVLFYSHKLLGRYASVTGDMQCLFWRAVQLAIKEDPVLHLRVTWTRSRVRTIKIAKIAQLFTPAAGPWAYSMDLE